MNNKIIPKFNPEESDKTGSDWYNYPETRNILREAGFELAIVYDQVTKYWKDFTFSYKINEKDLKRLLDETGKLELIRLSKL